MKKHVELPLVEPIYSTYHYQGSAAAAISANPSIRNWYLNQSLILQCNTKFLSGFTSPEINIAKSSLGKNPYFQKYRYSLRFTKGFTLPIIRQLLDNGFYVYFKKADDYYISGKSWYKERHEKHDGLIYGYDQERRIFQILAYNQRWIYTTFQTPQRGFLKACQEMIGRGEDVAICGIKPVEEQVPLDPAMICRKLKEYLDSSMDRHPVTGEELVFGIVVHDYIAVYLDRLMNGSIPYERMDRRVFRLIWEHKKAMLERLEKVEQALNIKSETSTAYAPLVAEANTMRMLYASHHMRRRDSVLPVIRRKLLALKDQEQGLLLAFLEKAEGKIDQ